MDAITERSTLPAPDLGEMNESLLRVMRGVNAQAFATFGNRVRSGPFFGMEIPEFNPFWDDGNSGAKLFGSYEMELHEAIQFALFRRPKVIVNVGCAEGYYAIGLKRMRKEAEVYALDLSGGSLALCDEFAKKNEVEVTTMLGATSIDDIQIPAQGHTLFFIDVEGAEMELIGADFFETSDLIIECHDFLVPGVSSEIADRLWRTHRVERIEAKLVDLIKFDVLRIYPSIMTVLAVLEKRPMPSSWLACWANRKGA